MLHKRENKESSKWVTRFLDLILILIRNLIHILLHILAGYLIALSDIINCICYGCNLYKNDMQGLVIKLRWQGNLIMN